MLSRSRAETLRLKSEQLRSSLAGGALPSSSTVADINKDDILDVVAGNLTSNSISTFLGVDLITAFTIHVGGDVQTSTVFHPQAINIAGSLIGGIQIGGNQSGTAPLVIGGELKGELVAHLFGNVIIGQDFLGLILATGPPPGAGAGNTLTVGGVIGGVVTPLTDVPPVGTGLGNLWAFDIVQHGGP